VSVSALRCRKGSPRPGLDTPLAVKKLQAYLAEQKGVDLILDEIMKRTAMSRDDAIDLFLGTYLTGRQDDMIKIFGAEPWARVVELSGSSQDWQTQRILKALEP
jgi:hypothetical protein